MNNRFKFRVWNKARQCFMPEKEIFICGNGELVLIDEALNRTWVKDNPNYAVSLCTGLHDKNSKLIYEGDICCNTKTDEIVSVDWHGTFASFVWSKPKYAKVYDFGELFRAYDYYEVIGNIYENKELLDE